MDGEGRAIGAWPVEGRGLKLRLCGRGEVWGELWDLADRDKGIWSVWLPAEVGRGLSHSLQLRVQGPVRLPVSPPESCLRSEAACVSEGQGKSAQLQMSPSTRLSQSIYKSACHPDS